MTLNSFVVARWTSTRLPLGAPAMSSTAHRPVTLLQPSIPVVSKSNAVVGTLSGTLISAGAARARRRLAPKPARATSAVVKNRRRGIVAITVDVIRMARTSLLRAIAVDGGAVARRQERADDVARGVERQRVRAGFRDDGLVTPQRRRVEDLDDPGVADRDVQSLQRRVEEHDVGRTGDRFGREERAAVRVRLEQHARVARAEEPAARDVEVEPVRPWVGDGDHAADADRITGLHDDDLRRIGDVDVERVGHRIVDGPARAAGHGRSEEHTSELQSRRDLVCRLLLEKKKKEDVRQVRHTPTGYTPTQ